MTKLSLSDVTRIINESGSPQELMYQYGIIEYLSDCDVMATNILRKVSDEDIETSMILITSVITSMQMEDGIDIKELMFIQSSMFRMACSIAFKMGVGIAAMEEYR